jgi:hypothetical protein
MLINLLVVAMAIGWRRIRAGTGCRIVNLRAEGTHPNGPRRGVPDRMRMFYLIVTILLIASLGVLEVVAARSVPLVP